MRRVDLFHERLCSALYADGVDTWSILDGLLGEFTAACGKGKAEDFFLFGMRSVVEANDAATVKAFADCCAAFIRAKQCPAIASR